MLARERKPEKLVITNLQIRESLRRALEREAEQHGFRSIRRSSTGSRTAWRLAIN